MSWNKKNQTVEFLKGKFDVNKIQKQRGHCLTITKNILETKIIPKNYPNA